MKKVLFAVLALATMASCSNEYTVDANKEAIGFGETFVDNSTKVDYSQTGKLVDNFKVYGTVSNVLIYNGNTVSRPTEVTNNGAYMDTAWICTAATQYWVPNATYNFAAIVDGGLSNVPEMPETIDFTVKGGAENKDLLYATAEVEVKNDGSKEGDVSTNGLVAFTFSHLLSKVYFDITENAPAGYSFKVTSIKATGVQEKGTYDIADEEWAPVAGTPIALEFVGGPLQILPVEQTLEITLTYDTYIGDDKISTATKSGKIKGEGEDEGYTFKPNTAYKVAATLTLENQIQFTVNSVGGFDNVDNNWTLQ